MKLEELRHLLAEAKAPESVSNVRVDYGSDNVWRATLNGRKGEIWEQVGVDVVISNDEHPEALQYARKCACGNMRDVVREPNSSVHVILPCEVCVKPVCVCCKRSDVKLWHHRDDRVCDRCYSTCYDLLSGEYEHK